MWDPKEPARPPPNEIAVSPIETAPVVAMESVVLPLQPPHPHPVSRIVG